MSDASEMVRRIAEAVGVPQKRRSPWRPTRRGGSFWRHVEDGMGVTVFPTGDGSWKWVYDGYYSETYASEFEAMGAAEEALDL